MSQTVAEPTKPTTLFENSKFLVRDHGALGVEVSFRIAECDQPIDHSRWFLDAAGDQVREFISLSTPDKAARLIERRMDVDAIPRVPGR